MSVNVNRYNISKNFNRSIEKSSQAASLNVPLLNNAIQDNQSDKFENKDKKNFFQNIKSHVKRLFDACNPKAKENSAVDNEQKDSFSSINSNLMVNDGDIHQGLYISSQKEGSRSIPILVRYNNVIYRNTSPILPEGYEAVEASSSTSNTPKTPFYPHSYNSQEEWNKKFFHESNYSSTTPDSPLEMSPLSNFSGSSF